MDRIDAFAHVMPPDFLAEMAAAHPTEELAALDDPRFTGHDVRLRDLDEFGVDRQVLTLARPTIWLGLEPGEALPLVRAANDAVRSFADVHPDRYVPVATIPFVGDGYAAELERCLDDLDMAGVQLFSHTPDHPVDSPGHRELYEVATDHGAPVWLHPQLHEWQPWDSDYLLHKMLGWPFDTSLAMGRLVFGGVLDEFPDLVVVPHHMGAMVPHFIDRMAGLHRMSVEYEELYPFEVNDVRGRVRELFGRFYGDTARAGAVGVLEDGFAFYGPDRLVFATDYPFGPEEGRKFLRDETGAVEAMDVTEAERAAVFGGNLERVLP
jgi:aminocarboxymuconate-semialdehyde decarboxylase